MQTFLGVGTREEPLRTSAWEASTGPQSLHAWRSTVGTTRNPQERLTRAERGFVLCGGKANYSCKTFGRAHSGSTPEASKQARRQRRADQNKFYIILIVF